MKRIVLIFIATACTALGLYAQPAPTYTLKSCLEQGLLNNYSLRIVRNEEQVSKNNATLGNAGYLPTLDLSAGYKGTIDNTEPEPPERQPRTTECLTKLSMQAST